MKNIKLLTILLWGSYLFSQQSKLDSVITKFKSDKKSYEQFIYFGILNCLDNHILLENNLLFYGYGSSFNSLYPLPRLISLDALKEQFNIYEKINFDKFNKKSSNEIFAYYNSFKICQKIYSNKAKLRRVYNNLISDKNSYINEAYYDLEKYMNDYLENYFIRIQTD